MNYPLVNAAEWYQAFTLTERLKLRREMGILSGNSNAELAQKRIQRWRSQSPFTTDSYFTQRLATDGISEAEFFSCLGEPVTTLQAGISTPPQWVTKIIEAFSQPKINNTLPLPENFPHQEIGKFLEIIQPLIQPYLHRLQQRVDKMAQQEQELPFDVANIVNLMFAYLPEQLLGMVSRTLVLELNVQRLQGLLQGETPAERFASFLAQMRQSEKALALLQEYPVLARQLVLRLESWLTCSWEFIQRLCADWQEICTAFSPESHPGILVKVDGGMGDRHRGGRSVLIAKFSSGLQVVYKPKSLAVEQHFQELLTWLNQKGANPLFRTLQIIERGSYGWVEFISAQGCSTPAEVKRFYQRQGAYLALLYALEATDFHCENLIAMGEHPMLIDLEALFHPRVAGVSLQQADDVANRTINFSVLRVGLLPQRSWRNDDSEGVDFSGLGAVKGQLTPVAVPQWEGVGTDKMRLTRKRVAMGGSQNRPTLNGEEIKVTDYIEDIAAGFTQLYDLLLKHRQELLSPTGLLAAFAEDEVRVIMRSTHTYAVVLRESFHPDVLRNALERDRLFDRLWTGIEYCPYLVKVIAAERQDLQHGDIPIFTTNPQSRAIWSSTNEEIPDFFDETGMSLVRRRIAQLSEADCQQQLWFIHASLATLGNATKAARGKKYELQPPKSQVTSKELLAAACAVGDRISALALRGEHDVSWLGIQLNAKEQWALMPLKIDLYDGLSGVALFLAYLGAITQEQRYTTLAQAALQTLQNQIQRSQSENQAIGAFNGLGGIIYTLAHLGKLWQQPQLITQAEEIAATLPALIAQDEILDIIGGAAGCLASLLTLYHCQPSPDTLALAVQCGEHLIASTQNPERGKIWREWNAKGKPLTGFSHGAAGIAWALLELREITQEERYRATAIELMDYEQNLFSHTAQNWPDLRDLARTSLGVDEGQDIFQCAWCHGAAGIGLARLGTMKRLYNPVLLPEINSALATTLKYGFGDNHSLCHGDAGSLEVLLQANLVLNQPRWRYQLQRMTAMVVESIDQYGWVCGNVLAVESPGLMTGLAGIGYQLLRLAKPGLVPSVLMLAAPIGK